MENRLYHAVAKQDLDTWLRTQISIPGSPAIAFVGCIIEREMMDNQLVATPVDPCFASAHSLLIWAWASEQPAASARDLHLFSPPTEYRHCSSRRPSFYIHVSVLRNWSTYHGLKMIRRRVGTEQLTSHFRDISISIAMELVLLKSKHVKIALASQLTSIDLIL